MASALVQTANPAVTSASSSQAVMSSTTQLGNLIVVFVGFSGLTETVSSVTDLGKNTYVQAYIANGGTGGTTECWYAQNTVPADRVTANFSGSVSSKSLYVREYSGMWQASALDKTKTASGSGTSVTTGASTATINAAELVVCNTTCLGTSPTLSVGAGYGNYSSQTIISSASLHAIEDKVVSAIGTQTGTMTAGGTLPVWDVGLATFVIADTNVFNNYQFAKDGGTGDTGILSFTEKIR